MLTLASLLVNFPNTFFPDISMMILLPNSHTVEGASNNTTYHTTNDTFRK